MSQGKGNEREGSRRQGNEMEEKRGKEQRVKGNQEVFSAAELMLKILTPGRGSATSQALWQLVPRFCPRVSR